MDGTDSNLFGSCVELARQRATSSDETREMQVVADI